MAEPGKAGGKTPSRALAAVFAVIGPLGLGHLYLGQTKRAVAWLASSAIALVAFASALTPLGSSLGYGKVLAVLVAGAFLTWLAALIDVLAISEARYVAMRPLAVGGFWFCGFVLSLGLRFVVRGYLIEAFKIPSGAMQPTLLIGDHIMVDKASLRSRAPKRGETVVFKAPEHPDQAFVKRVIAVPGDTLELKSGHPWLNGWEVPHCRVGKTTLPDARPDCSGSLELEFLDGEAYLVFFDDCSAHDEKQGPYVVAAGEFWVLGDNRNNSFDSPHWFGGRGGGVPLANLEGRGLFRWYSPGDWSRYGTPLAKPVLPAFLAPLRTELDKCLAGRPPREKTRPPSARPH